MSRAPNDLMYFWKDGQIVTMSVYTKGVEVDAAGLNNYYCVDQFTTDHIHRYGKYKRGVWKHHPFDTFPPEFKAALLLMGIS